MRIAFVDYACDPAKPGTTGLSDLVWDMASRLAALGDEVHVVAPYTVEAVPDQAVHVHRFELPPIAYRNIIGHLFIVLRACRMLRQLGKLDVIHTPEYTSSAVIASFYRIAPVVFTEPGNIYDRVAHGNPYDRVTTWAYKLAARLTARNCAHCFATSEWMKGWWQWTGITPERISLIPLGVDTSVFKPAADARAKLGIDPERPIVLYAARLSRENGADVTLRAVASLKQAIPNIQLHMLGDGPERATLYRLADQLGIADSTIWHGWVDLSKLPLYYSAANTLAFSGFSGGTPRVMLQAMACGIPVVASSIGGIVDHVKHGETGLLFQAGCVEALTSHIRLILTDASIAQQMGQAGQAYIGSQVAWSILIPRIREIYAKVSGANPSAYSNRYMGEEAMLNREAAVEHYNIHTKQMQNRSWFYEWFLDAWDQHSIPYEAEICDVGCGTGALLSRLQARGYTHLTGTDFAPGCVVATQQQVPLASTFVHDIEQQPLSKRFDVITLTGVIDLVADPVSALQNIRASLKPRGIAFVTIRNRFAYWPLYHLRRLALLIPTARLRHWFLHFTTPLGMRRKDQPYEYIYSVGEMRALLRANGLKPVREHGYQFLPMLWIPDFPHLTQFAQSLDRFSHHLPGRSYYYWYVFACESDIASR